MQLLNWVQALVVVAVISASGLPTSAQVRKLPSPEALVETLRTGDFVTRQRTLDDLAANLGAAKDYVPLLRTSLGDKDRAVRQQAAMALAAFGIDDPPVIKELLAGMGRRHPGRYHSQPEDALGAMAGFVKLGEKAVPALIAAMADESYDGRDLALRALGKIGPKAKDALPAIEQALSKRDQESLVMLVEVRWRIDGLADKALQELLPLLDDKRNFECNGVLRTLAHMDKDAAPAMPLLVRALKLHKDSNVLWAVGELAPHSPDIAKPALMAALREPSLADDAAIALRNLGAPAAEVLPNQFLRLRNCKPGDDSNPRQIVYTIAIYEPDAKQYTAQLIEFLKHENAEVARAAAWGLPRVGGNQQIVVAALKEALKDERVAKEASESLKALSGVQE